MPNGVKLQKEFENTFHLNGIIFILNKVIYFVGWFVLITLG